ncbi:MAG: TniQ family protein [Chloroflexota bacterium]|nr:TniQ family protein [Chloroflexota bacterium]MDQ5867156.1 TniQ family protein [Chloroflexota bacterium]
MQVNAWLAESDPSLSRVLEALNLPARSRLYSLEPIGVGTGLVESLTSYVARLAYAHRVTVSGLARVFLVPRHDATDYAGHPCQPQQPQRYPTLSTEHAVRAPLKNVLKNMPSYDGTGTSAERWVRILQALTLRSELHCLTILPWGAALSARGLLRLTRAWCPTCLSEWEARGKWCCATQSGRYGNLTQVYEPLLWRLQVVRVCPTHGRPLRTQCPHPDCGREQSSLHTYTRPGYCSWCYRWLGVSEEEEAKGESGRASWDEWVLSNVSQLIAAATHVLVPPQAPQAPQATLVREALAACVERFTGGNMEAFEREARLPHSVLQYPLRRGGLPQLATLLHVSYCMQVSLLDLLTNGASIATKLPARMRVPEWDVAPEAADAAHLIAHAPFTASTALAPPTPVLPVDPADIPLTGLNNAPVAEIAPNLQPGAITTDQAKRIRGEALPRAFVERAQRRLEAEVQLAQHTELPGQSPNSVHGIARELGCHPATLYRYFPELCKAVAERYVLYLRKRSMARDEALLQQVRGVVLKLLAEGKYPSSVRVSQALDKPGRMRDPVAQRAWRMALQEAGLEREDGPARVGI